MRARIDGVIAEQLLGRLETGQRRGPLTRMLLAVRKDADLRAVAALADPHHLVFERPALNLRGGVLRQEVRQVDARPRLDDAGAGDDGRVLDTRELVGHDELPRVQVRVDRVRPPGSRYS